VRAYILTPKRYKIQIVVFHPRAEKFIYAREINSGADFVKCRSIVGAIKTGCHLPSETSVLIFLARELQPRVLAVHTPLEIADNAGNKKKCENCAKSKAWSKILRTQEERRKVIFLQHLSQPFCAVVDFSYEMKTSWY